MKNSGKSCCVICKWLPSEILCFHTSASTVVTMALGVPRADFLESHHLTRQMNTPWLNSFPCRVERIVRTGRKFRSLCYLFDGILMQDSPFSLFLAGKLYCCGCLSCSGQYTGMGFSKVYHVTSNIMPPVQLPKFLYKYILYCTSLITLDCSLLNMQYQIKV